MVFTSDESRVKFQHKSLLSRTELRKFSSYLTEKFQDKYDTFAILLGNILTTSSLGGKVYSRHGPYVTITREARAMILDDREDGYCGIRYPTVTELARFSGFNGAQRNFLTSLPTEKEALLIIASAVTYNTDLTIWSAICDHAFGDLERNYFFSQKHLHHLDLQLKPTDDARDNDSVQSFEAMCPRLLSTGAGISSETVAEHLPDMGLRQGNSRPSVQKAALPAANSAGGITLARAAWKLHDTLCPCSSETFENTVAITLGHQVAQGASAICQNCPKCLQFNRDFYAFGQHSKSDTAMYRRWKPGECISIDGADANTRSLFGQYSIVLIVVDMGSMKTYSCYLKGNSAREFVESMDNVRKQLALETGNRLKSVYADDFSTYKDHQLVAEWRELNHIELLSNPPYAKQYNAYAENRIRSLKKATRANLSRLKGVEIGGKVITDPTPFWPFAWEHARQSFNLRSHTTLEQWYQVPCSPDQAASSNFAPRKVRLLPFATMGFLHIEKDKRDGPMHPTNERCYYMFSGSYNMLVNKFSNMYRAHIVFTADTGAVKSTGKVVWAHSKELEDKALIGQRYLPGYRATDNDVAVADAEVFVPPAQLQKTQLPSTQAVQQDSAVSPPAHADYGTATGISASQPIAGAVAGDPPAADGAADDAADGADTVDFGMVPAAEAAEEATRAGLDAGVIASPKTYTGRRVRKTFAGRTYTGVVGRRYTDVKDAGGNALDKPVWNIRYEDGDREDLTEHELVPILLPDDAALSPVLDAPIPQADELPSLSDLFKRDNVKITLHGKALSQSQVKHKGSAAAARWNSYRRATTVGEYKRLGGTSADFLWDLHPTRRFFTFVDPELARLHLKFADSRLDDGGVFSCDDKFSGTLSKLSLTNHPAVAKQFDRLNANAMFGLDGPNPLAVCAYKAILEHCLAYSTTSVYGGRGTTLEIDDLRTELLYHFHSLEGDACVEFALISKDDLLIDTTELISLRGVPQDQWPAFADAIAKEMGGLLDLGTFEIVLDTGDREKLPTKLVLKTKYKADGTFDKHRARLVVQGFHQRIGQDFFSTFSPMASLTSVRMMLALSVHLGLPVIHMDVPQAFIQALVDADILVKLPKGIHILHPDDKRPVEQHGKALRLLKSLYGLKQAPQLWNKELTKALNELGFKRLSSESSIYLRKDDRADGDGDPSNYKGDQRWVAVLAEVDDLLITGTDTDYITVMNTYFRDKWHVKDWEPINSFLGIRIMYDVSRGCLSMDVQNKLDDLYKSHKDGFGKLGYSNVAYLEQPVKSAMQQPDRALTDTEVYMKRFYANIVGSLIYLSITCRPDITFAVNQMARGMHSPQLHHLVQMKQCLKYLNGHRHLALTYRRSGNMIEGLFRQLGGMDGALQSLVATSDSPPDPIIMFADASYADCPVTRKSTSGEADYFFNCLTNWRSKRQPVIATSTHEAELVALSMAAHEGIWLRRLVEELGVLGNHDILGSSGRLPPTPLLGDNKASTFSANNPSSGTMSKHIDVRHKKVREYVASGDLRVVHVRTDYNVADFFTKGLNIGKFAMFRDFLMGEQLSKHLQKLEHKQLKSFLEKRFGHLSPLVAAS